MVMSIAGGAIVPLLLGYMARQINMQIAYAVPLCVSFLFSIMDGRL
jgi:fucose permease